MKSMIASVLFLGSGYAAGGSWNYQHMDEWVNVNGMCGLPNNSPINIHHEEAVRDSSYCEPGLNWTVDWSVHSWKVANNGHSIAVIPMARIDHNPDMVIESTEQDELGHEYSTLTLPSNSIGKLPNYFLPEGSNNTEFCLHSFHFHWGDHDEEGSEHLLDDFQYPLEVHFVHYSCARDDIGQVLSTYPDAAATQSATDHGLDKFELAVVGIFLEVTEWDNPAFDAIMSDDVLDAVRLPSEPGSKIIDSLYLQDLIPQGVFTDGYYSYEGSLTTPPCTDIVRWHVMNSKSYIGKSQMARFREVMETFNKTQSPNFRDPVYNQNPVYACMSDEVDEVNATERAIVWIWGVVIVIAMCAMGCICYARSKRKETAVLPPPKKKRERLFSASSAGHGHGDGHGHGHGQTDTHAHGHH